MIFSPRVGTGACDVVLDDAEVIIDDADRCFRRSGSYWWNEAAGTGGSSWWTWAFEGAARDSWPRGQHRRGLSR